MKSTQTKTLLIRISLIISLSAALLAAGLSLHKVQRKISNLQAFARQETERAREAELSLMKNQAMLNQTRRDLEIARMETAKALATAQEQAERARTAVMALARVRGESERTQVQLSRFEAAGMQPEEIVTAAAEMKKFRETASADQKENQALKEMIRSAEAGTVGSSGDSLPAQLKARILVCDPRWQFIVLNAGRAEGARENGELLVSRNGQLVGRVKISRVLANQSIANIVPGFQPGATLLEGDLLIPAHPRS